jgi:hypothetical protein
MGIDVEPRAIEDAKRNLRSAVANGRARLACRDFFKADDVVSIIGA